MIKLLLMLIGFGVLFIVTANYAYSDDLIVLGKGHSPVYISNSDSGRFDFSNDGLTDYYVKAHYTGNENQMYKVDYKIQDECVDGNNFEDAKMKLGFTAQPNVWINEGIEAWTPWFKSPKSQDDNGLINLVYLPPGTIPNSYPQSNNGEDVIQGLATQKQGSFTHKESIKELDNQSGWEGSILFNAPAGKYFMWTIHPATGIDGCDRLAALGVPIIIKN
ncbi:MAG TPA: hypothetical protein VLD64_03640 [Nitrosarchaeum sp.]|jgi:hypothetical protein|nr:hypothetical protein [Nitrosarchaeum sp.]